jgi:hypothetical protein
VILATARGLCSASVRQIGGNSKRGGNNRDDTRWRSGPVTPGRRYRVMARTDVQAPGRGGKLTSQNDWKGGRDHVKSWRT